MKFLFIILFTLIAVFLIISVYFICYLTSKEYRKKYKRCLLDVDEAILDVYKATQMIMDFADAAQIDATVVETIVSNFIIQRIFTQAEVIYSFETNPKWIQKRLDVLKQNQIK
jgi:hypothetical protein